MSLEFRHIAHAYTGRTGRVEALCDIAFTAPSGKITCLLGSSGSGKSTLLNLAAGLLPVQAGSIRVGGQEIASARVNPPPEARPIGLVFQDGALFPHMTIANNIAFGLSSSGEAGLIEKWLARVGLAGLGPRFPHELSGGQQQRAALARAMAPEPQVLLMDEPFASVDIVLRRRLLRDFRGSGLVRPLANAQRVHEEVVARREGRVFAPTDRRAQRVFRHAEGLYSLRSFSS